MGQTPKLSLPYPELADSADVPRDIKALADALDGLSAIPAGVIQMWPDAAAPGGWFLCDGQPVPAASNPGLAAIFGTTSGNVILPDLRGRVLVGAAPIDVPATGDPARALRALGGASTVQLTAAQSGLQDHQHDMVGNNFGGTPPAVTSTPKAIVGTTVPGSGTRSLPAPVNGSFNYGISVGGVPGGARAGASHENMPPYYAINHIIKAG
jgi:microcystin-dependent protein